MTKVRKKIGNIPINTIKQDLQDTVDASVTQMRQDVTDFIDEETAQYPEIGGAFKFQEDPEERSEITTDSEGKIISYRDADGVKHEEVGIVIPDKSAKKIIEQSKDVIETLTGSNSKQYNYLHVPRYGSINIIPNETPASLVNMPDYTDSSFKCLVTGTTNAPYIEEEGTKIFSEDWEAVEYDSNNKPWSASGSYVAYSKNQMYHYETNPETGEKTLVYDWPIDKNVKHKSKVEVDIPGYITKTFDAEVSFQGASTLTMYPKKNFRITFYKDSTFKKKQKIKIGDMVKMNGYNVKAYYKDATRLLEPMLNQLIHFINESKEYDKQYPWNKKFPTFTGSTGTIKGFPIKITVDGDFYGLEFFCEKKNDANYMLNGDESGMMVIGDARGVIENKFWEVYYPGCWEDEMNDEEDWAEGYHTTQSNVDAITAWYDYFNNHLAENTVEEHFDKPVWIDYFIICQVFYMWDNLGNNLMLYSDENKVKMTPFFYDLDTSMQGAVNADVLQNSYIIERYGYQTLWEKLLPLWWEDIVLRYQELRKGALQLSVITDIFEYIGRAIDYSDYEEERDKWILSDTTGGVSKANNALSALIEKIKGRLNFCDSYFKN